MQNIDSLSVGNHQSSMQVQIYIAVEVSSNGMYSLRFLFVYWLEDHYMEEWRVGVVYVEESVVHMGGALGEGVGVHVGE